MLPSDRFNIQGHVSRGFETVREAFAQQDEQLRAGKPGVGAQFVPEAALEACPPVDQIPRDLLPRGGLGGANVTQSARAVRHARVKRCTRAKHTPSFLQGGTGVTDVFEQVQGHGEIEGHIREWQA